MEIIKINGEYFGYVEEDLDFEDLEELKQSGKRENRRGFPRPTRKYVGSNPELHGRQVPMPWATGANPTTGLWAAIDNERSRELEDRYLCLMCGEPLGQNWVYGLLAGQPHDRGYDFFERGPGDAPSPTWMHIKCAILGVLYCPHLKNQEYPCMDQDQKTFLTLDNLRQRMRRLRNSDSTTSSAGGLTKSNVNGSG